MYKGHCYYTYCRRTHNLGAFGGAGGKFMSCFEMVTESVRCDDDSVFGIKQTIYRRLPAPVPGQGVT